MDFDVISPATTDELLRTIADSQSGAFRFGAGYTDLLLELKKLSDSHLTVINLARLTDVQFTSSAECDGGIRIGALVTANRLASDRSLGSKYPVLVEAANNLASRQIRQVATVGGNLCTASPAGDVSCALMALRAQCEILDAEGNLRTVPSSEYFVDVRKTCLRKNEVLRSILLHSNNNNSRLHSGFIKIGTRRSMECAVVSLAYHIQTDRNDGVTSAGVAIGSVAPTIRFAESASDYLIGRNLYSLSSSESEQFALRVLEYASPISDLRASAGYRRQVLFNISRIIFDKR